VGVFRIDQTLETLRPFSDDDKGAVQAVHVILESTPSTYQSKSDREKLRGLRQTLLGLGGIGSPASATGSAPAEFAGREVGAQDVTASARGSERYIAFYRLRAEIAMLEASEALERDQQGLTTVNSILALVNGLRTAPGRKAVVFFSEGLMLPPRVASALRSVIAEANRGGVTFYAADAGGLRTVSGADETRRELAGIVEEIRQGERTPGGGRDAAAQPSRPMTKALERNEDILRLDPKSGLGTLARETGGFLVSDTNDIARSLRPAEEDLASYYLLEYAPGNELWDGRFRRIEVKVRRPGIHVQARQGYFAVRTPLPTPLLDYESPVLAALEMAPRANDLAFLLAVAQVPDQADESAVPVLVEVAGDVPTLDLDPKAKRYQQDFTVLVLVRGEGGRVVRKLSRRFATAGPLEKAEEARRARILVLRETWLPPGRYTVETAVQDAASGRLGVQRAPLEIPATAETLRVSSLVVVGHAAPRGEGPAEAPALVAQGMQLYPSAAGPVSASSGRPLPFFLVASPAPGRAVLRATVELRQDDTPVFSAPADFTSAIGRSTLLGGVPLDGIAPGDYELRVTVADGVDRAVRWAKVTIAP
jgi:VWFA-related protein